MAVPTKGRNATVIVLSAVVVVILAGASYLAVADTQNPGTIGSLNSQNSALQSQAASQGNQVSALQSVSSTMSVATSSLQSQMSSLNSQIASLKSNLTSLQAQRDLLAKNNTNLQAAITTLTSQISRLNANLTSLQSTFNLYQSYLNLTNKTTLMNTQKITISPGTSTSNGIQASRTKVLNFTAKYAGLLVISASTDSAKISPPTFDIIYSYSSIPNSLGCQVLTCVNGYAYVGVGSFNQRSIVPILSGPMQISLLNWSDQSLTVTVTIDYYS